MITRREAARSAALTALSYSRILGANDRIGLGVIGTGGRGTYVMGLFHKNADVEVRALCDVYPARFREALATAPNARTFPDHRKLLNRVCQPARRGRDGLIRSSGIGKVIHS